jgi:hypothetical protein
LGSGVGNRGINIINGIAAELCFDLLTRASHPKAPRPPSIVRTAHTQQHVRQGSRESTGHTPAADAWQYPAVPHATFSASSGSYNKSIESTEVRE